jgi:hypothetical protein
MLAKLQRQLRQLGINLPQTVFFGRV